ncbi:YegP family protein [Kushneria phosphatilytica]|uniref:DUF1508 domain-containing protein n=1 Tax=Kushneria phosphatilytica TaxID=657387 RepID=A0A5C1A1G8_9GAMM|nr:YegP family protein [Kushneria phosphatilytica]QEL12231.1 DUF1508 domain-containing protein [Kushneria phosphatilytica]
MAGYYELTRRGGHYHFNLKADNNQVILSSETYESRAGALNGIGSCQENSPHDDRYDRLTARDGSPYFNLKARNGQVIGTSEMYSSTQARENGIASCKTNGPTKDIRDKT